MAKTLISLIKKSNSFIFTLSIDFQSARDHVTIYNVMIVLVWLRMRIEIIRHCHVVFPLLQLVVPCQNFLNV